VEGKVSDSVSNLLDAILRLQLAFLAIGLREPVTLVLADQQEVFGLESVVRRNAGHMLAQYAASGKTKIAGLEIAAMVRA
jgi:hypothetical protein